MTPETKYGAVNVTLKALDPDDPAGQFEAILSAPTLDRDGEIIDAKAFEPLPDHITIDVDHGMSTATTVGSGTPFYDGDLLKFRGTFSTLPRAQEVRTLVAEGHIRKMSVAFMNANREVSADDERVHIRSAELLNAAIVPIPSNRDASILSAKSAETAAMNMAACPKCAADESASEMADLTKAAISNITEQMRSMHRDQFAPDTGEAAAHAPADTTPDLSAVKARVLLWAQAEAFLT